MRTKVSELREHLTDKGIDPKGTTVAALLDELQKAGGSGEGVTPQQVAAAVEAYMESHKGGLTDADMDDIFAD